MDIKIIRIALLLLGILCAANLSELRRIPKALRRNDVYDGIVRKSMKQLLGRSKRQSDDEPKATPNQEYFSDASSSFSQPQTYGSSSLTSVSDHVTYTNSDDKSQAISSKYVFPDKIRYASLTDPASTPAPTRPPTTTPGTGRHSAQYGKYHSGSLYTGGGGGSVSGTQLYRGNQQSNRGSGSYGGATPMSNYYSGGQQQDYYSQYQQRQSPYQGGYQAKQQSYPSQGYGPTSYVNPYASSATYSNQNSYRGADYSQYADPYAQSSSYGGRNQGYQSGSQLPRDSSGNPLSNGVYGRPMGGRTTYTGSDIRVGSSSTRFNPSSFRPSGSLPYSNGYSNVGSSSMSGMQMANPYATASSSGRSRYESSYGGNPYYYGQSSNSDGYGSRTQGSLSNPSYGVSNSYANPYSSSGRYYGSSSARNPSYEEYTRSSYGSSQSPYNGLNSMSSHRSHESSVSGMPQTSYGSSGGMAQSSNYRDSQTGYGSSSYGGAASPYGSSSSSRASGSVYGSSNNGRTSGSVYGSSDNDRTSGSVYGSSDNGRTSGSIYGSSGNGRTSGSVYGRSSSSGTSDSTYGSFRRPNVGQNSLYGSQTMSSEVSNSGFGNGMSPGSSRFTYGSPSLSGGRESYGSSSPSQGGTGSSYGLSGMPQDGSSYSYGNSRFPSNSPYGSSRTTQQGMSGSSSGVSGTPSLYSTSGQSQVVSRTFGGSSGRPDSSRSSGTSYDNSAFSDRPTYGSSSAPSSYANSNSVSQYISSDGGSTGGFLYSSSKDQKSPDLQYGKSSSSSSGTESETPYTGQSSDRSRLQSSSNVPTVRGSYLNPSVSSGSSYQYQYPHSTSSSGSSQGSSGTSQEGNYQAPIQTGSYDSIYGGGSQASISQVYQSSNKVGTETDESKYTPGLSNLFPLSQESGNEQPDSGQLYTYQGSSQYGSDNERARPSISSTTSLNSGRGRHEATNNIATRYFSSESQSDILLIPDSGKYVATYSSTGRQNDPSASPTERPSDIANASASNVATNTNYNAENRLTISGGSSSLFGSSSQEEERRNNPMRILPSRSRGRNRGHRVTSVSQETATISQPEVPSTTSSSVAPSRGYGQTGNSAYEAGYSDSYPNAYDPNDYSTEDTPEETNEESSSQDTPQSTTATTRAPPRGNRQRNSVILTQSGSQPSGTSQAAYFHSVQTSRNGGQAQSSSISSVSTLRRPGYWQHGTTRRIGNVDSGVLLVRMRNLSHSNPRPTKQLPSVSSPILNALQQQEQRKKLPDIKLDQRKLITYFFVDIKPLSSLLCAKGAGCLSSSANQASRSSQRKLLRFQTTVHNIGNAPFLPALAKSDWTFHQCHNHSHSMDVFTHYDLLDLNRKKVAEGHKASFCLEDSSCKNNIKKTFDCDRGHQGISAGCEDTYQASIDCQWIDITGVYQGEYIFRVTINPDRLVPESDYSNNGIECHVTIKRFTAEIWDCKVVGV